MFFLLVRIKNIIFSDVQSITPPVRQTGCKTYKFTKQHVTPMGTVKIACKGGSTTTLVIYYKGLMKEYIMEF